MAMAAFVRHVFRQQIFTKYEAVRFYASKIKHNKKNNNASGRRIDSIGESIYSKGFLRSYKPYTPPQNVIENLQKICKEVKIPLENHSFKNLNEKSLFLELCFKTFQHGVPNSLLHEINSVDNAFEFYQTPVNTTLPLDAMKNMDLPENLHIIHDYTRFHPDEDTKFNGKTAFPKSSTLVTGLKYKKKYSGHIAKTSWP